MDIRRYGALALVLSLGGVVLAVVLGLLARILGANADMAAYLVFCSFQIAALVLGIVARRMPLGKAATITAAVLMVGSLTLVA
jgi:hypothetical protein